MSPFTDDVYLTITPCYPSIFVWPASGYVFCCSDSAARRISIKALQDRVPLESRCCLAASLVLLFRRIILCEGKNRNTAGHRHIEIDG